MILSILEAIFPEMAMFKYIEASVYPLVKKQIDRWELNRMESYGKWIWKERAKNEASSLTLTATPIPKKGTQSAIVSIEVMDDNQRLVRRMHFELPITNDPQSDAKAYYEHMRKYLTQILPDVI